MGFPMTPSPMKPIVSATITSFRCGYNPNVKRFTMTRAAMVAAVFAISAAPLVVNAKGAVSGVYVEARTAEVFTGGCIMGSEAETVGKQAVLAWKVDRGSFNGIALDGLSVVAALSGDVNLGIHEIGGARATVKSAEIGRAHV